MKKTQRKKKCVLLTWFEAENAQELWSLRDKHQLGQGIGNNRRLISSPFPRKGVIWNSELSLMISLEFFYLVLFIWIVKCEEEQCIRIAHLHFSLIFSEESFQATGGRNKKWREKNFEDFYSMAFPYLAGSGTKQRNMLKLRTEQKSMMMLFLWHDKLHACLSYGGRFSNEITSACVGYLFIFAIETKSRQIHLSYDVASAIKQTMVGSDA